jgi:hypothetical protein
MAAQVDELSMLSTLIIVEVQEDERITHQHEFPEEAITES